jgi:hypothetical protein
MVVTQWLQRLGLTVVRSDSVPTPKKGHTPTVLDRCAGPRTRKTFTPVRHPDDPGTWRYLLQELAFEQTVEDRHRLTDWLNNPRGWRRLR